MRRAALGALAAALALGGCGSAQPDLTGPALLLPVDTVAYVAGDRAALRKVATGAAGRALQPFAADRAALFALPDEHGLAYGALVEARDDAAARSGYARVRALVRAARRRPPPASFPARLRDAPQAAAIVGGRWVVFGDPHAVRATTLSANGTGLGETVPFRRAVEEWRDRGDGLLYADPRPLAAGVLAGMGLAARQAKPLADFLLEVRFARPVGGAVHVRPDGVRVDTGSQDGCPVRPRAAAGEGPADAELVTALPLYGLAQRQCRARPAADVALPLRRGRVDLTKALGWLVPSRLAVRSGALSISALVADPMEAAARLPALGRALDAQPRVRAKVTERRRLDLTIPGLPVVRLTLRPDRALVFAGPPAPPPITEEAKTTPAYRRAQQLLGDRTVTALWRDPWPGVALVATGATTYGADARGSGARLVIALR